MRNFRLSLDLSDIYLELQKLDLREYTKPFMFKFVEARDPDDACNLLIKFIIKEIMNKSRSLEARILCKKIRRLIRIDKIESL